MRLPSTPIAVVVGILMSAASAHAQEGRSSSPQSARVQTAPANSNNASRAAASLQLAIAKEFAAGDGLKPAGREQHGILANGAETTLTVSLPKGSGAMLYGVCDDNCGNLDMWVTDSAGNSVAKDVENDAAPIVSFLAKAGGSYRVRLKMQACGSSRCGFAVAAFAE
jgi:hypothetical protein